MANELTIRIKSDIRGFQAGINTVTTQVKKLGANMQTALTGSMAGGTAARGRGGAFGAFGAGTLLGGASLKPLLKVGAIYAAGRAVQSTVKDFASFDKAMREVWTVSNLTKEQFFELTDSVQKLSESFGVDRIQTAYAQYEAFSRITKEVPDSLKATELGLKTSIAGMTDARGAMVTLAQTYNAFKDQNITLQQVADGLFKTIYDGGITFKDLEVGLGALNGTAASLGVTFQEQMAAVTALTDVLPADRALTSLTQAMTSMAKPSSEIEKIAKKAGIALGVEALRGEGLTEILKKIKILYEQDAQAASELAGEKKALLAILNLVGGQSENYTQQLYNQANAAGALDAAHKKMADGITTAGQRMATSWQGLKDVFVQAFEGDMKRAANFWSDQMNAIRDSLQKTGVVEDVREVGILGSTATVLNPFLYLERRKSIELDRQIRELNLARDAAKISEELDNKIRGQGERVSMAGGAINYYHYGNLNLKNWEDIASAGIVS